MANQISQTITLAPDAPNRLSPDNFADKAADFVAWLEGLDSEMNAYADQANALATEAETHAAEAENSAQVAANSSGATAWDSGTTYDKNDVAIGSDFQSYRSRENGNQGNDPVGGGGVFWAKLTGDINAATLTASVTTGDVETLTLANTLSGPPQVSVTKEVPQPEQTSQEWFADSSGDKYGVEDTSPDTTLTPSGTSGQITLSLGSGSFASADVGKTITGNGGVAVLLATDGSADATTAFNDTSTIDSADWAMRGVVFDNNKVLISNIIQGWGDISGSSFDNASFSFSGEDGAPRGVFLKPDGTKMYMIGAINNSVYQYTLSTPWDLSTSSFDNVSFDVSGQESFAKSLFFKSDGTKMYVIGAGSDSVYQYTLSTPWDLSTASFDNVSFDISGQDDFSQAIFFKPDGTKMYIAGFDGASVYQYTLSTAWDLSSSSFDSISFNVSGQVTNFTGLSFKTNGSKMYVMGQDSDSVHQYTLSTAWDVSSASFDNVSFDVSGQDTSPKAIFFKSDGTKIYIVGDFSESIYQYSMATLTLAPITQWLPAHTNDTGQIDSTFWTDINSMSATDSPNGESVMYAISTDARNEYQIVQSTDGPRRIVRNNSGTWQVNTDTTYANEAWTNATQNDRFGALSEAMQTTVNRMDATQLANAGDADHVTLGDELDLAIILRTDDAASIPKSSGVEIKYDVAALLKGAIIGTDYDWDNPAANTARITALKANNIRVRVL